MPFNGKVDIKNSQHVFHIVEDYGDDPNSAPLDPVRIFFGRWVGNGQRNLISRYAVRERHFIGNTSMDAQLSFIMANQAKVSLEPKRFACTTGSEITTSQWPHTSKLEWSIKELK